MAGVLSLPNNTESLGSSPGSSILLVVEVLLLLWILVVNFLLWVVLRITRAFHRPLSYLLANLILANYLLGASSLPFSIINDGLLWRWPFGVGLCELWHGFDVICRTAFTWFIVCIVVERWLYCYKRRWHMARRTRHVIIALVVVWILTVVLSGIAFLVIGRPNFFSFMDPQQEFFQCYWSNQNPTYAMYHTVTAFFLPLLLALLLYIILLLCVRRAGKLYSRRVTAVTTQVRRMTSGTEVSEWSEMSLPATPFTNNTNPTPRSMNTPSVLASSTTSKVTQGQVELLQLSPVRRPIKVAPLYSEDRPPSRAWGDEEPEKEPERVSSRANSRLSWANIIFSKMLIQRAMKTPASKPTVNEDLIKTLPKNRVPRRLPSLDQATGNLPKLDSFLMDKLAQAPRAQRMSVDGVEPEVLPNALPDSPDKPKHGNTPGGGRDSGFDSNTPGTERRASKWDKVNGIGGMQEGMNRMPSPFDTTDNGKLETETEGGDDEEDMYDEASDNPVEHLQAIKWIWVIILLAFITWLPFYAVYLALNFCSDCEVGYLLFSAMTWLGWLSAALNPFILMLAVSEYRRALGWLIKCRDPNKLYYDGVQGEEVSDIDDEEEEGEGEEEEDEDEVVSEEKTKNEEVEDEEITKLNLHKINNDEDELDVKRRDSGGKYVLDNGYDVSDLVEEFQV